MHILGPVNSTSEWSSRGEKAGAWIKLTWPKSYLITGITLYDRPNQNEYALRFVLRVYADFNSSDGSLQVLSNSQTAQLLLSVPLPTTAKHLLSTCPRPSTPPALRSRSTLLVLTHGTLACQNLPSLVATLLHHHLNWRSLLRRSRL